jgi:hypothetical protein
LSSDAIQRRQSTSRGTLCLIVLLLLCYLFCNFISDIAPCFVLHRIIQTLSRFLLSLKVEKSKKGPLSLMTIRKLHLLWMNPWILENLRVLPKVLRRHNLLLPLSPRKAKGRGMMSKIPALPKPKKLILHIRRQLTILILNPSSARKSFLFLLISVLEMFVLSCFLCCRFLITAMMRKKYQLLTWLLGRARHILYLPRIR